MEESAQDQVSSILEITREHSNILPGFDVINETHSDAVSKINDVEKLVSQGKVGNTTLDSMKEKKNILSGIAEAELNYYHDIRKPDIKKVMYIYVILHKCYCYG